MSNPAISISDLGKKYRKGETLAYSTLRDSIAGGVRSLLSGIGDNGDRHRAEQQTTNNKQHTNSEFWALRDVSFAVEQGEVVGIIGRNGAGKSTLLKILSQITEPTRGEIRVRGRVASLLEVGTGFHWELSGRENIFLNGAILGMHRAEIKRKFDEIVEFAEVHDFIDTPVKRYSSGMYVRLAFAVAAHLEPEILLVDEVLAVGDAAFQKKCLGKMGDVVKEGRTILFVSHNMAAIQALCPKAIWIDKGVLQSYGDVSKVVSQYLGATSDLAVTAASSDDLSRVERGAWLRPVYVKGRLNNTPLMGYHHLYPRKCCDFEFTIRAPGLLRQCTIGVHFETREGVRAYALNTRWFMKKIDLHKGTYQVRCRIPELPLVPGHYFLSFGVFADNKQLDWLERITHLEIAETDVYGTGELPWPGQGYFLAEGEWNIKEV